jgi:hypothetical protein
MVEVVVGQLVAPATDAALLAGCRDPVADALADQRALRTVDAVG